jgi:hypothetical protein
MKYILIQTDDYILGPFTTIKKESNGYLADGALFPTSNYGTLTVSEVTDDYMSPTDIAVYNNKQSDLRAKAYPIESDPMFFEWQRGTKTEQEWLDAVNAIKAKYPYKDIA